MITTYIYTYALQLMLKLCVLAVVLRVEKTEWLRKMEGMTDDRMVRKCLWRMCRVYVQGEDQGKDGLMIWKRIEQLITELSCTAWCELAMFLLRTGLRYYLQQPPALETKLCMIDWLIDWSTLWHIRMHTYTHVRTYIHLRITCHAQ